VANSSTSALITQAPLMVTSDIASSTRIAGRCQSNVVTSGIEATVLLFTSSTAGRAAPTTYGDSTGTSTGVSVDPGGSANTKGSYAQITSSTSSTFSLVAIITNLNQVISPSFGEWSVDLSTGAGGSEVVVVPDMVLQTDNVTIIGTLPMIFTLPLTVASGTRLAARAQSTITNATNRIVLVEVIAQTAIPTGSTSAGGSYAFA
jgi:hypothetical protein